MNGVSGTILPPTGILPANLADLFGLQSEAMAARLLAEPALHSRIVARLDALLGPVPPLPSDGAEILGRMAACYPDRHEQLFRIMSLIVNRSAVLACTNGALLRDATQDMGQDAEQRQGQGGGMAAILVELPTVALGPLPQMAGLAALVPGAIAAVASRLQKEALGLLPRQMVVRLALRVLRGGLPVPVACDGQAARQALLRLIAAGLDLLSRMDAGYAKD